MPRCAKDGRSSEAIDAYNRAMDIEIARVTPAQKNRLIRALKRVLAYDDAIAGGIREAIDQEDA